LKVLDKGQFILYSRGKPFLSKGFEMDNKPNLVPFQDVKKFLPNLENEAVFLRLHDDSGVCQNLYHAFN